MKITKQIYNKAFSFISQAQKHYLYGTKINIKDNKQQALKQQQLNHNQYIFEMTKQQYTGKLPQNLFLLKTINKQSQQLQAKNFQIISNSQINEHIIHLFFIGFRLPYEAYQFQIQGFIWKQKVYSNQIQDIQNLIHDISSCHQMYKKQNYQRLTSQKCTNITTPLTYTIEVIYIPKRINQISIQNKSFNKNATKIYQSILIHSHLKNKIKQYALILNQQVNQIVKDNLKHYQTITIQSRIQRTSQPKKIFNPHFMCKSIDKQNFLKYYTKGIYEYYHYGDQKFSDIGWGCMYRSLQTLLSWLNLQNYYIFNLNQTEVPSIIQIQTIIDTIDSTRKIRNTNQWIGAVEASWVINKLTGIDCRIIHVEDGKQILQHCQAFRQHFDKVGSPIPYGGGQYAYSIVGMNYNWKLRQCQFLILDPHYAENDDYSNIVEKKGISWRKISDMFKKGIFYNFCLPIIK